MEGMGSMKALDEEEASLLELYRRLDDYDRIRIRERMDFFLEREQEAREARRKGWRVASGGEGARE